MVQLRQVHPSNSFFYPSVPIFGAFNFEHIAPALHFPPLLSMFKIRHKNIYRPLRTLI
jgi:hypothetical protein